jgi:HlyD family secretion protein
MYWIALVALALLIATGVIWAYTGTVITTAEGHGVVVRRGGLLNVVSQGGGIVLSLKVKAGDKVEASQTLARVAQPALMEQMRVVQQAMAEAVDERDTALRLHDNAVRLQVEALNHQHLNVEREIKELEQQGKIVADQVSDEQDLLAKGLVTRRQLLDAQEKQITITDKIDGFKAQLQQFDAQKFSLESEPGQELTDKRLRVTNLRRQIAQLEHQTALAENVTSPFGGEITETKTSPGSMVSVGQPIVSIQPEQKTLDLVGYVSSSKAKYAKVGMDAHVSPSIVRVEEFGFMKGKVVFVSDYPATPASFIRNFANESLAQSLTNAGPVNEVWVRLEEDPGNQTGFAWSGLRSPQVVITSGTLCTFEIVTRRQRPITLLVPSVKEKLGLR